MTATDHITNADNNMLQRDREQTHRLHEPTHVNGRSDDRPGHHGKTGRGIRLSTRAT